MNHPLSGAFAEALKLVQESRRVAILTHMRADGDAIGSAAALQHLIRLEGRKAHAMLFEPPSPRYAFMTQRETLLLFDDGSGSAAVDDADLWILVDSAARLQLVPMQRRLDSRSVRLLVIDHHRTRDIVGDVEIVDENASAAALLVAEWSRAAGWPLTSVAAELLFVGLATDTGWFRHAGADARTYRAAAELIAAGARPDDLFARLYLTEPPERFRLFAEVMHAASFEADGQLAVMCVTPAIMKQCNATAGMTEDLINEPLKIQTVRASLLLTEMETGEIRASLRGKEGVDVGRVAETFGGGGHRLAAGCRLSGPLAAARERLVAAVAALLPPAAR